MIIFDLNDSAEAACELVAVPGMYYDYFHVVLVSVVRGPITKCQT